MRVSSFFVIDENFLLHRRRALRLQELMRQSGKSWSLYVFSSANTLTRYTMEEIVGLGISWVWLGREGKNSAYAKLKGTAGSCRPSRTTGRSPPGLADLRRKTART